MRLLSFTRLASIQSICGFLLQFEALQGSRTVLKSPQAPYKSPEGTSVRVCARTIPKDGQVALKMFEDLDFVAIGVGDKCHLFAIDKFLAPVARPEIYFKAVCFECFKHFAVCIDGIDSNTGVD